MSVALSVDIGGTKLEVGIVDDSGVIDDRSRVSAVGAVSADDLWLAVKYDDLMSFKCLTDIL